MSLSSEDATPVVAAEGDAVSPVAERDGVERPLGALSDVEVIATVELGRAQLLVRDILKLRHGAVIELEKLVGQPADLLVNTMPFAKGEVIVVNGRFGFRITKFVSPSGA
ncbi:MAG TPA: FliM/FliN family flagellar motor switch protein [Armatimonadota bacterium]|nr:FliM/FliN family flagellar motor switch protein [Armatimonadota bacterium]